jgi:hypothetical protein
VTLPPVRLRPSTQVGEAVSCPLCHGSLERGEERASVPVSPVVWPGVVGLDVHAGCLAAARRGAFELPAPRSRVGLAAAGALALLLFGSAAGLRALLPGDGWLLPALAALLLLPVLALLALAAGAWLVDRVDAAGRPGP